MSDAVPAVRRPLNSPRAAALAGVLFALLFTTALALIRSAMPETLTADIRMARLCGRRRA